MRLVLDFETYFDGEYSLKKMHTLEYVRDSRFHVHGASVKTNENTAEFLSGDDLRVFIDELILHGEDTELICHNTYFDGLILHEHYGYVPQVYRDTLSMSRALLPHSPSHELDYLAKLFRLGEKLPDILDQTKGLRTLPIELQAQLAEYANQDVELTSKLAEKFIPALPDSELQLIHLTLKWGCRPVLHVDLPRAKEAYEAVCNERNERIEESGVPVEILSSQPQFTALLEELDIAVPMKRNKKDKLIPALAKNDLGFQQMIADYPEHRPLFDARLAAKSTIDVTRTKRVIDIGSSGTLPMPLKFYGAHTGRWSGADGLNPQNFRRKSELRKSIIAPPGHVLLVSDLKQIEARLNMWFCKEDYWLEVFRQGIDIYTALASDHFGVPLEEVTSAQRFFGKTLELGLGYQMGWAKFRNTCALRGIVMDEAKAYGTVQHYRNTHPKIQAKWYYLSAVLNNMYQEGCEIEDGPVTYMHECAALPNGMRIDYSNLQPLENGNWVYGFGDKTKYIYGGKMLENMIQALARIVLAGHILEIEAQGIDTVTSTHDEVLMVVPESDADKQQALVTEIMRTPPEWAPDLPLDVDIGHSREYSK